MTLSEFKAWFEGFTEDIEGATTAAQFEKIKAKVAKIDGTPITPTVIREYYHRYQPWWGYGSYPIGVVTAGGLASQPNSYTGAIAQNQVGSRNHEMQDAQANTAGALYDLGKAEYKAMQQ